ncbi:hypothetical protein DUNSADRAFT_15081 [Dunaliella salina]|uniref:Uncharacterized protein n=1 Tax=Dunaliella salina TaxID=3046 RepID=A0ABQ7G631_DUNSA|nr:hypothetical protein DUNSADRAFT_15081 [Dunaliella salina]|eukprot:KAF5830062.1 hypothetical protein DUNSADRAFT_15081 [Dunaliella salina]
MVDQHWCPDTANISDWRDKQGAFHRLIEHEPIKGVTSDMLRWWFSPALPIFSPLVPFRGEKVYWYKLWHPIDHKAVIPAPGLSPDFHPALWVIVSEKYRKTQAEGHPQDFLPEVYDMYNPKVKAASDAYSSATGALRDV